MVVLSSKYGKIILRKIKSRKQDLLKRKNMSFFVFEEDRKFKWEYKIFSQYFLQFRVESISVILLKQVGCG